MFIGHAPSGYIAARLLFRTCSKRGVPALLFFAAGIGGALAPDLDLVYFYLIDQRLHHHHTFFPHLPVVWMGPMLISAIGLHFAKSSKPAALAFIFCLGGLLHLILDSVVGDIWWFGPFIDTPYSMFTVPALHKPWWLNFVFHWTFALEIALWIGAIYLHRNHRRRSEKAICPSPQ